MFTYVNLKKFKSFGDIRFDFKKTQKETKKFVAIYGENGSGKSNFVSVFELIGFTINSFALSNLHAMLSDNQESFSGLVPRDQIQSAIKMLSTSLSDFRMIGCDEATTVELGFNIGGVDGYYKFSFKEEFISEELYYLCGKKRGKMFSINSENGIREINKSVFSPEYSKDFDKELDKYWGKHSFLGIFVHEISEKNRSFIDANVSEDFTKVYFELNCVHVSCTKNNAQMRMGAVKNSPYNLFPSPDVPIEIIIERNERLLNDLFCQLYSDIKEIYYEKNIPDNSKLPPLHVKKIIAGEVRDVLFDYESSGTKRILELVDAIIAVMNGYTVIYDEIDNGIHDLLTTTIITSLVNSAPGQLIITTHNTLLLESIDPQSAYVIYVDCDGNKESRCIADYGERIQKTNNMRNLYLKGMYGGIPYTSEIDFSYFVNNSESAGDDNAE